MAKKQAAANLKAIQSLVDKPTRLDTSGAQEALARIGREEAAAREAKAARDAELKEVKVTKDHLILLVKELDMSVPDADRLLREHNDDVVAAMRHVIAAE